MQPTENIQQHSYLVGLLLLCLSCTTFFEHARAAEHLPVEAFASLPAIGSLGLIGLSPSGEHLAYVLNSHGHSVLVTQNLQTGKRNFITRTNNEKYVFQWLKWVSSERLIFSLYFPSRREGVASGERRLLSASVRDAKVKAVLKPRSVRDGGHISQFQDRVVSTLPADPEHVLLALDAEEQAFPGVYRVNVKTGGRKRVQRHKKPIRSWWADQEGELRAGVGFEMNTTVRSLWVRRSGSEHWHKLEEYETFERANITPLGFGRDPRTLYVRDVHEGRYAVFKIDTASEGFERELVVSDPDYDIDGALIRSPKTGEVIGVRHYHAPGSTLYLDPHYQSFQNSLQRAFPDTHNRIVNFSDDEMKYLVITSSSSKGGVYHLGDRERGTISPILHNYPLLQDEDLSQSGRFVYTARDGTDIESYLWLPQVKAAENLPLILFPHGGPMSSDRGGFDYWTHFFTNRGYAVLQPNFRGSSDYGYEFSMASLAQWGLAMQDDLEDGVRALVAEGVVDPARVCIVGASYGGYAALMGVAKTPEVYQCAVSFAGISSLLDLRNSSRHYLNKKVVNKQLGSDRDQLQATSPVNHVERIVAPILLAHGYRDRVVPVAQSRKMASALKKNGKQYQYLELDHGSHGLAFEKNRLAFFEAMDAFLARHLPVGR